MSNKSKQQRHKRKMGLNRPTNTISDPSILNMFLHVRIGTNTQGPYHEPIPIEGKNKYLNHNGFNVYFFLVHQKDQSHKQYMFHSDLVILKDHTQEDNYLLYYISQDTPDLAQFDHLLKKDTLPDGKIINTYGDNTTMVQEFIEDNKILYQGPFLAVRLLISHFKFTKDEKQRTVFLDKEYLNNKFHQDLQMIQETTFTSKHDKEKNNV